MELVECRVLNQVKYFDKVNFSPEYFSIIIIIFSNVIDRECPELPQPELGTVVTLSGREFGGKATYTCPIGYNVVGVIFEFTFVRIIILINLTDLLK